MLRLQGLLQRLRFYGRHEPSDIERKPLGSEAIAAIAGAIGAIASAVIAVYALVVLVRQEDIAKNQVRATFLSNLYTKQAEGFTALWS